MKTKAIVTGCIAALLIFSTAAAQTVRKEYFSTSSSQDKDNKNYGVLNITADKQTVVIGTIMAYGENVKGLTIKINNGFTFKLAPAQNGTILNYVGNALNIVLQPGDKATIEFINNSKVAGVRQLYASGENID
ncbi:MAG: hypothetical protein IPP72_20635 [Chitinophagaceae bacterium]|nr:hypothetical protein [Chitinophagaceae bacterium]